MAGKLPRAYRRSWVLAFRSSNEATLSALTHSPTLPALSMLLSAAHDLVQSHVVFYGVAPNHAVLAAVLVADDNPAGTWPASISSKEKVFSSDGSALASGAGGAASHSGGPFGGMVLPQGSHAA